MNIRCITTQQIVYWPVDIPSSVSMSGLKSAAGRLSWAYASRFNNWALGRGAGEYTYPGGKLSIWERLAVSLSPSGAGGVPSSTGVGSGVGCLCQSGRSETSLLHPQRVCGVIMAPCWQGTYPPLWLWKIKAGCLSIAASTFQCAGNSTPRFSPSWTSARRFLIWDCSSFIVPHKNPPFAILARSMARPMSDCSSWTQPPYLAIVVASSKTYKILCAASNHAILLLCQLYMLPWPPLRWLKHVSTTLVDPNYGIQLRKSHCCIDQDVWFRGMHWQISWQTLEDSHHGQR